MQPKAPFIAHSLFPVVVAVWFAALLGAGFLVLPDALLARIVGATGIAALIPAAAPPLGTKAGMIIAATAALFGALTGYVLARQLAAMRGRISAPHDLDRRLRRKSEDAETRRPISAKDEFDVDAFDAPLAPEPRSRRFVPKPAAAAPVDDILHLADQVEAESAAVEWPEPEAAAPESTAPEWETAEADEHEWVPAEWARREWVPSESLASESPTSESTDFVDEELPVETGIEANAFGHREEAPLPGAETAAEWPQVEWPEVAAPVVEQQETPAFTAAPAETTRREVSWPDADVSDLNDTDTTPEADRFADIAPPAAFTPPAFTPEAHRQFTPHKVPTRVPFEGVPLEQLGMVQLTERLGISLQKRLERNRGIMPPPPPGLATILGRPELEPRPAPAAPTFDKPAPEAITPTPTEEAFALEPAPAPAPEPRAVFAPTLAPAPEPQHAAEPAPQPVVDSLASWPLVTPAEPSALDVPQDGEFRPETNRTPPALRLLAYELDDFGEDELEYEYDDASEDAGYSSLVSMKTPPRPEKPPVPTEFEPENPADFSPTSISRPFDSPAAPAPANPQTDRQDTEQALRSALTRLQGLSGAA